MRKMKVTGAEKMFTVRERSRMVHLVEAAVVKTSNGVVMIEVIPGMVAIQSKKRRGIKTKTTKVVAIVIGDMIIDMSISALEVLEIIVVREVENGHEINIEEREMSEEISMTVIEAKDKTTGAGPMVKRSYPSQNPILRKSVMIDLEAEIGDLSIEASSPEGMMEDVISKRSKINLGKTFVKISIEKIVIDMAQSVAGMTTMMKNVMVGVEVLPVITILDPKREKTRSKVCDLKMT